MEICDFLLFSSVHILSIHTTNDIITIAALLTYDCNFAKAL